MSSLIKCDIITLFYTIASVSMITGFVNTVALILAVLTITWIGAFHATICSGVSILAASRISLKVIFIPNIKSINCIFNKQSIRTLNTMMCLLYHIFDMRNDGL